MGVYALYSPAMADLDEGEGPVVTGISPTIGLPGTKVTIRGENLGESKDDVIGMSEQDLVGEFT